MPEKPTLLTLDEAERLAIGGLAFLAGRPEALSRFLALNGIGPATLRTAAADPAFLAGVLDHFLGHEALLIEYASDAGISPARIGAARRALGEGSE
jgi:hypothetical protein